jgi:hypothetical protein
MQQIDAIMSNQGSKQERTDSLLKQLVEVEAVNVALKGTAVRVRDGKLTHQAGGGGPRARPLA